MVSFWNPCKKTGKYRLMGLIHGVVQLGGKWETVSLSRANILKDQNILQCFPLEYQLISRSIYNTVMHCLSTELHSDTCIVGDFITVWISNLDGLGYYTLGLHSCTAGDCSEYCRQLNTVVGVSIPKYI